MPKKPSVHTVPNSKDGGWNNVQGGKVLSHHDTKKPAVTRGRDEARADRTEHVIHNQNGTISQANSYGHDPCPPKDKK